MTVLASSLSQASFSTPSPLAVIAGQFNVEHLALPHTLHAGNAKRAQRALDGLALRVQYRGLERDDHTRFHVTHS